VVGESIAKLSEPLYVHDGILYVGTSSGPWANELDFQKREILSRLNTHLGEGVVRDIRFQSRSAKKDFPSHEEDMFPPLTTSEKEKVDQVVARIENENIRKAFRKLVSQGMRFEKFKKK